MKIAQVAPLIESVPPRLYGGTERIVSYLTEELVGLGPRCDALCKWRLHHQRRVDPVLYALRFALILPCATSFRTSC